MGKLIDPHDDSFIAKNLNQEEWVEYQRDSDAKELAAAIKAAFDNGMVARVSCAMLYDLGWFMAAKAGTSPSLMRDRSHDHWAALALSMMTHGRFQCYPEEHCYRFSKSPYNQAPMWYDNIVYAIQKGFHYLVPVRKEIETEATGPARMRENNKTDGAAGEGSGGWNATGQGSLFNIYEGS